MNDESRHIKHLTEEELAFYAEHLANNTLEKIPEGIRGHVAHCDECALEALAIADILNIEKLHRKNKIRELPRKIVNNKAIHTSMYIAAGVAVIIGLFFIIQQKPTSNYNNTGEQHKLVENKKAGTPVNEQSKNVKEAGQAQKKETRDKTQEKKTKPVQKENKTAEKQYIATNYSPDPILEKLTQRFSNGTLRDPGIQVKSATKIEAKDGGPVLLQWENPRNEKLILELFNNEGQRIKETELSGSQYSMPSDLLPGLYYWKLLNMDFDLLFCGKIYILSE